MKLWKKNPAPDEHHFNDTRHETLQDEVKRLRDRVYALTAKVDRQAALYNLDVNEDVLVTCSLVSGEEIAIPLSQISARIEQIMMTKLSAKVGRASRTAKSVKPQMENLSASRSLVSGEERSIPLSQDELHNQGWAYVTGVTKSVKPPTESEQ